MDQKAKSKETQSDVGVGCPLVADIVTGKSPANAVTPKHYILNYVTAYRK